MALRVRSLVEFAAGYVEVEVIGPRPERLINLATMEELVVWDIRYGEATVTARLSIGSFFALRPLARKARCRVRILARRGLPFLFRRLRRRHALWAGASASLALLYAVSSFVWFVHVNGAGEVDPQVVLEAAARHGLRAGTRRAEVDRDAVATGILLEVPRLSWAAVELRGTLAVIEVVEKAVAPPHLDERVPADLVAAEDGVLEVFIPLAGQALVRKGQAVTRGQLLVRGLKPVRSPPGNLDEPADPRAWAVEFVAVRARATVRARVWREEVVSVPLVRRFDRRTGRTERRWLLRVGGRAILIPGSPILEGERVETFRFPPPGGTFALPVEVTGIQVHELERVEETLTQEAARDLALAIAERLLMRRLPADAVVIRRLPETVAVAADRVTVRLAIETREDIGRPESH